MLFFSPFFRPKSISSLDLSSLNYRVLGTAAAVPQDPRVNKPRPTAWCRLTDCYMSVKQGTVWLSLAQWNIRCCVGLLGDCSEEAQLGSGPFVPSPSCHLNHRPVDSKPWVSSWTMKGLWRHVLGWWDRKTEWVGKSLRTVAVPNPDYKCLPSGLLRLEKLLPLI